MLLGHRYYDSDTGRFLTRDPVQDGRNWYGYGGGYTDPVNGVDPEGLQMLVGALPFAAGAALADGPLPIGDAIGLTILLVAAIAQVAVTVGEHTRRAIPKAADHDSNKRPSTENKHEKGKARSDKEQAKAQARRKQADKTSAPPSQPDKNSPEYRRLGPKKNKKGV